VRREQAIYIGKGAQAVAFGSADADQPAKFKLKTS
jgi:4-deoxy-L-threo-5-hexosulose-uronate ketol-isomerase